MNAPILLICPGIHHPKLTASFINGLRTSNPLQQKCQATEILVFPTNSSPAYSSFHIWQYLQCHLIPQPDNTPHPSSPVVIISFSAGVAGAIGAAWSWRLLGGQIGAFFALDGWGVPLWGDFPIYRLSHDYFTHYSSALLGKGDQSFYADPAVEHLQLWELPQTVQGWWHPQSSLNYEPSHPTTAALFLVTLLKRHGVFLPPLN